MLNNEQLVKYAKWIDECDSALDAHGLIRGDLGREMEESEIDYLMNYVESRGKNAQIEPSCRNNADTSDNCELKIMCRDAEPVLAPVYDKISRIKELANHLADIYCRKNQDYGDSFGISVRKYGIIAALTRMSDKWNRLENLILSRGKGAAIPCVQDESILDTLLDMATYSLMTYMEIEQEE